MRFLRSLFHESRPRLNFWCVTDRQLFFGSAALKHLRISPSLSGIVHHGVEESHIDVNQIKFHQGIRIVITAWVEATRRCLELDGRSTGSGCLPTSHRMQAAHLVVLILFHSLNLNDRNIHCSHWKFNAERQLSTQTCHS